MSKRTTRLVLLTIINFLLLAIIGILCLYVSLIVVPRVEAELNLHLRDNLPESIQYDSLDIGFLPPKLVIRFIDVSGQLTLDELQLRPGLWELLGGTITLNHLVIQHPRFVLSGGNGQLSLSSVRETMEEFVGNIDHDYLPARSINRITVEDGVLEGFPAQRAPNESIDFHPIRLDLKPIDGSIWRGPLDAVIKSGVNGQNQSIAYNGTINFFGSNDMLEGRLILNKLPIEPWTDFIEGLSATKPGWIEADVPVDFGEGRLATNHPTISVSGLEVTGEPLRIKQPSGLIQRVDVNEAKITVKNSMIAARLGSRRIRRAVSEATLRVSAAHLSRASSGARGTLKVNGLSLRDVFSSPAAGPIKIRSQAASGSSRFEWSDNRLNIFETEIRIDEPSLDFLESATQPLPSIPSFVTSVGPVDLEFRDPTLVARGRRFPLPTTRFSVAHTALDTAPITWEGLVETDRSSAEFLNTVIPNKWSLESGTARGQTRFRLHTDRLTLINTHVQLKETFWTTKGQSRTVTPKSDTPGSAWQWPAGVVIDSVNINLQKSIVDYSFFGSVPPLEIESLSVFGKNLNDPVQQSRFNANVSLGYPQLSGNVQGTLPSPTEPSRRIRLKSQLKPGNLPELNPYLEPHRFFPFRIEDGSLTLETKGWVSRDRLDFVAHLSFRNLQVSQSDPTKHDFLGKPIDFVRLFIQHRRGNVDLTYDIAGPLDNPRFRRR